MKDTKDMFMLADTNRTKKKLGKQQKGHLEALQAGWQLRTRSRGQRTSLYGIRPDGQKVSYWVTASGIPVKLSYAVIEKLVQRGLVERVSVEDSATLESLVERGLLSPGANESLREYSYRLVHKHEAEETEPVQLPLISESQI